MTFNVTRTLFPWARQKCVDASAIRSTGTKTMHSRLLSFLSDVESTFRASETVNGSFKASRTVNYRLGLARLNLAMTPGALGTAGNTATILIQSFRLADGSPCMKAQVSWPGSESRAIHAIHAKPGTDWTAEAAKVADILKAGPVHAVGVEAVEQTAA